MTGLKKKLMGNNELGRTNMIDIKTRFIDEFEDFNTELKIVQSHSSFAKRKTAFEKFANSPLPTIKNEEWKYTPLTFLAKNEFTPTYRTTANSISSKIIDGLIFGGLNEITLVFVNGFYSKELSTIRSTIKDGVFLGSIKDGIEADIEAAQLLGDTVVDEHDSFVNLNTAYFTDGALIVIPDNLVMKETIHLIYISSDNTVNSFINYRNLVLVGENSQVRIVETVHHLADNMTVLNSVTEITAGRDSLVDYNKFQNEKKNLYNFGSTFVRQNKNSTLHSNTITMNSKFVRNSLNTVFAEENCEAVFDGFYFVDNDDFVDNHTLVDHAKSNCRSNETYKGIIGGKAVAVFNGKVMVRPDAQKTISYQSNKNVLLSDDATINTKPQLEIFADDVKCSHGATSGSLDETALFYLRARGISEEKSKSLLLNAFSSEVIDKINIPELRDSIREQIGHRLGIEDIFLCYSLDDSIK